MLSGNGPVIARRIADRREMNGAFETIEEPQKVKGIGPVTLERIGDLISVREFPRGFSSTPHRLMRRQVFHSCCKSRLACSLRISLLAATFSRNERRRSSSSILAARSCNSV